LTRVTKTAFLPRLAVRQDFDRDAFRRVDDPLDCSSFQSQARFLV